jgi:NitT/TauT family transport system permease protein
MSAEQLEAMKAAALTIEEAEPTIVWPVAPARRFRAGAWLRLVVAPAVVFAGFVAIWYLLSWRFLPIVLGRDATPKFLRSIILPYPHDVVKVAFLDPANLGSLLSGLWLDARLSFFGLAISTTFGVLTAVAMRQARWVENSFYPYAVFLQTVPILALVPLIGLFLGFGFTARLIVVVIISLFPIITNTLFGLKSADQGLHDLFTLHTKSRRVRLSKLELPASMPAMFTGFQISAGLSVIGAIVGDFFFGRGEKGLGNLIDLYSNRLRPEELWAAVLLSTTLGLFVFFSFGWLRVRLTGHWHESAGAKK